jgi:hypothetical protein
MQSTADFQKAVHVCMTQTLQRTLQHACRHRGSDTVCEPTLATRSHSAHMCGSWSVARCWQQLPHGVHHDGTEKLAVSSLPSLWQARRGTRLGSAAAAANPSARAASTHERDTPRQRTHASSRPGSHVHPWTRWEASRGVHAVDQYAFGFIGLCSVAECQQQPRPCHRW